jgi:hypothetical protein
MNTSAPTIYDEESKENGAERTNLFLNTATDQGAQISEQASLPLKGKIQSSPRIWPK